MARYINPFSDWSFKRIFGQEYSKDLLIEFLNQLLLGEQHITNVKFKDKEMLPETKHSWSCQSTYPIPSRLLSCLLF